MPAVIDRLLLFGAAHIDRLARSPGRVILGASNPAVVEERFGGVAWNIGTVVRRLGGLTIGLFSAVGNDLDGARVLSALTEDRIDTLQVPRLVDQRTANFIGLFDGAGDLVVAAADMAIYDAIPPALLPLDDGAPAWLVDANLPAAAIQAVTARAKDRVLIGHAVSLPKCVKLAPVLDRLNFLFANATEAGTLANLPVTDTASAIAAGHALRQAGAGTVFITLGAAGAVVCHADGADALPALPARVVDVNGAGDAFAGGVLHVILTAGSTVDVRCPPQAILFRALRQGLACAAIAVEQQGRADRAITPDAVAARMPT